MGALGTTKVERMHKIAEKIFSLDLALHQPSEDLFYHYTTINVVEHFFGDNPSLYATHYKDLNDDAEFELGFKCLENYFKRVDDVLSKLKELRNEFHIGARLLNFSPWIMSFSTDADSLHQWVAYTDKRLGGYAVGFRGSKLECLISDKEAYLLPCVYVDGVNEKGVFDNSIQLNSLIQWMIDGDVFPNEMNDVERILKVIWVVSSIIKHKAFSIENEWRLIVFDANIDLLRVRNIGGKMRIPISYSPAKDLIDRIVVSPCNKSNNFRHALPYAHVITEHGKSKHPIKMSNIPYNGR